MRFIVASLALVALSVASPVPDTADSYPGTFKIASVVSGGSGCPQGSIEVHYTDSRILPVYFGSDFTVSVGPKVGVDSSRKNCQLNLNLQYSPGWQYAVYSADYAGYGQLDEGVKGTVKSTYYFSGNKQQVSSALTIQGPFQNAYNQHDDIAVSLWSPCESSALLNINSEVSLTPVGTSASGSLIAVWETARFEHQLYFKWRQC